MSRIWNLVFSVLTKQQQITSKSKQSALCNTLERWFWELWDFTGAGVCGGVGKGFDFLKCHIWAGEMSLREIF